MSLAVQAHPDKIAGSRTLVVGGTSGIGAAVVSAALANSGTVHISSSNPERVASKITEFKALYPEALVTGTAADLSNENTLEENVKSVLEEAVKALGGPIDHLVYTAGDGVRYLGPLLFAKIISGNPDTYLKVNSASSITLTSGGLAHKPIPGVADFIGWAGAVEALTRGLAVDLSPVRVNVVAPGAIYTEMLATLDDAMIRKFGESTLLKRVGTASETAEAYNFSMRSSFLTGEVIKVDGGALLA